MQIDLPSSEQNRLAALAAEAGYESVERFATEHLLALAHNPKEAEFAPLTDEELKVSLAMCDESMAQIDRGEGLTVEEARKETINQLRSNNQ